MPATSRLVINQAQLRTNLTGPRGIVTRYVMRQVRQIGNKARLYCPVDTGNLRASITTAVNSPVSGGGMVIEGRVGTPVEYAVAVHEGHAAMSVTVHAHGVRAHTRKNGTQVKEHQVRQHWRTIGAREGRPFLRRAMEEVIDSPA